MRVLAAEWSCSLAVDVSKTAFITSCAMSRTALLSVSPCIGSGVPRYERHALIAVVSRCMSRRNVMWPCVQQCFITLRTLYFWCTLSLFSRLRRKASSWWHACG